jgi:hypothetical protein
MPGAVRELRELVARFDLRVEVGNVDAVQWVLAEEQWSRHER